MNGIILAGGKSLRFGEDKVFTKVRGSILIESLISLLTPLFDNLIVVTNHPERLAGYPVRVTSDKTRGIGPIAGIQAGLMASDSETNFVLACDMPLISAGLIKYMQTIKGYEAVVPSIEEKVEPLHAIYSKTCLPIIEQQIKAGRYKIQEMFFKLSVCYINEEVIRNFDPNLISFLNINSKKDLEKLDPIMRTTTRVVPTIKN